VGGAWVITVANQVDKIEYFYQCDVEPLCSHCNKSECKKRKYGIGSGGEISANIQRVIKVMTDPVIWYLEIDDHRIELSTDQLLNFQLLKRAALESLDRIIGQMKNSEWQEILQKMLEENLEIVHMPADSGSSGAFMGMLSDFLTNNAASPNFEDLLNGVPHFDKKEGKYVFRLSDLMDYLSARKFTQYSTAKVSSKLREIGAEYGTTRVKGKQVRWWKLSPPDDEQDEDFKVQEPEELPLQ